MSNSELIVKYIKTYAELISNMNTGRGTERLSNREVKLRKEMVERGIITQEQADELNK